MTNKPHWIAENTRTKSNMWICSECGRIAYDRPMGAKKYWLVKQPCTYQYCPYCGVKMESDNDEMSKV